ncbi:MAG: peptidoglycan-binding domain-containing protein, partial [Gemmatimonadaceae bacterium]
MTGMRLALLTAGVLAAIVAPPPSAASAQQDTARQDSTRRGAASTGSKPVQIDAGRLNHTMRNDSLPHRTASKGTMGMGLTHAHLRELQQALASAGCDPGPVDGVAGPRTYAAMRCAAGKKGLAAGGVGANINDLF